MTSIRHRLIAGLLLGLTVLLAASGTFLYYLVKSVLEQQFDATLLAEAHAVCNLIRTQSNGDVEADLPSEAVSQLATPVRPQFFQAWREDGSVLLRSPALNERTLPFEPTAEKPVYADMELPQHRPGRVVRVRFVPPAEDDDAADAKARKAPSATDKTVTVAVAQDRSQLQQTMTVLLWSLVGVAVAAAAGTAAVVTFVVRRGLQPLKRVASEASQIDPQSLALRFSLSGLPVELQPICSRLNDSLDRLQAAFERERRFTAAAAHELRTPIAELRSLADVALKWDGDRDKSLGYFKDARDISEQMEAVVTTLLSLARCQSRAAPVAREPVDLIESVRKAWCGCEQQAIERHVAATFALPERLMLETDRTMVFSMLSNLLANAAQYSKTGGSICCKAEIGRLLARFSVSNETDSLSIDDLPHLREAFWRKDTARSDGLHCGLGLTLVDAYATALGGRLDFSLPRPELLCVAIELPLSVS